MPTHLVTGARGEHTAENFLVGKSYEILARNWRQGSYELDLVARDPQTNEIVFVEVKTRSSGSFGHPSDAVDAHKLKSLFRAARAFLRHSDLDNDFRFDIISVLPGRVEHFENVTWIR